MFKKILVTTDASEYSRRALQTALALAKQFSAEIYLLHVTYTPEAYIGYAVSYGVSVSQEELQRTGELAIAATLTGIDTEGVAIHQLVDSGYPAGVILRRMSDLNIDITVMGSHGYGPLVGSMLGSVSQRVLAHASCPVLIVK